MTSGLRPGICAILFATTMAAAEDPAEAEKRYRQSVLDTYGLGQSRIGEPAPAEEPQATTRYNWEDDVYEGSADQPAAWRVLVQRLPTQGTSDVDGTEVESEFSSVWRVAAGMLVDGGAGGWDCGLYVTTTKATDDPLTVRGYGVVIEPVYAFSTSVPGLTIEAAVPLGLSRESWSQPGWSESALAKEIALTGRAVWHLSKWQVIGELGYQRTSRTFTFSYYDSNLAQTVEQDWTYNTSGMMAGIGIGRSF
jgi:hypothetical protein